MKKVALFTFILFLLQTPAAGQALPGPPLNEKSVASFFDTEVPLLIEKNHIPGISIAVVQKGRTIFNQGYGYSNLENKIKVEAQKTMFRSGSVGKLFTWVAIMQLVEREKIDLNKNINEYLDFQIPDTFPEPITMLHIMNHSAGFEDRVINLMVKDSEKLLSLQEAISTHIPARVRPPGEISSYSNYSTALAGYIIERLTGLSYEEYIEKYIFAPLQMKRASFHQPLPEKFQADMATGYSWEGQERGLIAQEFELIHFRPAGSLSVTSAEMTRFLIALLDPSGGKILKPETRKMMLSRSDPGGPEQPGIAHGFFEMTHGKLKLFHHAGGTFYFYSNFVFIPERECGFYITVNGGAASSAYELTRQFLDHFFPIPTGRELSTKPAQKMPASKLTGNYITIRRSESDLTRISSIFMNASIKPAPGGLYISSYLNPGHTKEENLYYEIEPLVFQQANSSARFYFVQAPKEKSYRLVADIAPPLPFVSTPWQERVELNIAVVALTLLLIIAGAILKPTGVLRYFKPAHPPSPAESKASKMGVLLLLAHLIFLAALAWPFFTSDPIFGGEPTTWSHLPFLFLAISWFRALLSLFTVWSLRLWSLLERIHYSALTGVSFLYLVFLVYWKIAF